MSKYITIIGYPLKHSVSPIVQQAALDHCHLDVRYESRETKVDEFDIEVRQLRKSEYLGANVTVPYKEKVLNLLDAIDEQARLIGAVNTIISRNGLLIGYNTDAYGFLEALRQDIRFELSGKQVTLIGAGGVARAAGFALLETGIASMVILNRTLERAIKLARSLNGYITSRGLGINVLASSWQSSEYREMVGNSQLIVNCTTMGMKHSAQETQSPLLTSEIPSDALVYDLVYNPPETPLLRLARDAGAMVLGGLPMLVYQGAVGFELWVEKKAPVDIMFKAAKKALYGHDEEILDGTI